MQGMVQKQYTGFKVRQRQNPDAISFFVFAANAKDVSQWTAVDRLEERQGGIQRRLSKARLRAIQKFFVQDHRNVIPTSVVLAFLPGVTSFTASTISGRRNKFSK
jgi:hypothetical protein